MALAQKSGVAQTTISNYLNPGRRGTGKSGKAASAKLTELELLAEALGVEAWTLIQPIKSSPGI
ncbi:helix-turn-helix domain-containing protein [Comamonas thiooxydans]|uniref:helix-turn-helix domain-containing protein n=1 Tax=Comamonas thiooxydans TaxID=363952 RepID=UPI000B407193